MSQKKVDEYKKEKLNRKKIIAKQKRNDMLMKIAGIVITIAFMGFIIFSAYDKWIKEDEGATVPTYALSAEEVSSVFKAYTSEEETTQPTSEDTTTADSSPETTVAE